MVIDGFSAIAVIIIAAFGIDRIVRGTLFVLSFIGPWRKKFSPAKPGLSAVEKQAAERREQFAYFLLAGILGIAVLGFLGNIRIFAALGFKEIPGILDGIMTGLILVAGADRMSFLLDMAGSGNGGTQESAPIEVTGTLTLEGDRGRLSGEQQ